MSKLSKSTYKNSKWRTICSLALLGGLIGMLTAVRARGDELIQLPYNNPGLAVDLGVGLWAWPVPCDADNDGDYDLIVSCPDQPSNGVWLFENVTGDTANDKFPVFKAGRKLSPTKHYVMPSYVDGKLRVLRPGVEYLDFAQSGLKKEKPLPVNVNFYKPVGKQPKGPKVRHHQWRYVDFEGDGALDLVVGIEDWSDYGWDDAWNREGVWQNGPLHGFVFILKNVGSNDAPKYEKPQQLQAENGAIDTFGCPSPNFADFDSDGDLDLLCGEFLDGFTYFENVGTRTKPKYATSKRLKLDNGAMLVMDLEMIVPVAFDWDRDGDVDLIVGDEDGRVALVENTGKLHVDRTPIFLAPRYFQQSADTLKCGALATPVTCDWDGDGDFDIISGNTAGYLEYFENLSGPQVEFPKWAAPQRLHAGNREFRIMAGPNGSIQGPAEAKWGYTSPFVVDWNGDGKLDVLYNSIWGKIEWLENVGTRTEPKLAAPRPIEVDTKEVQPKPAWTWWTPHGKALVTQWRTTPVAVDWNKDGLVDLVMLDHEGYLAFYERAKRDGEIVLLPPRRVFVAAPKSDHKPSLLRLNDRTAGGSGRRKLTIVDWDGDGALDILINSRNADVLRQVKEPSGHWAFENRGPLSKKDIEGHSTSPTVVDFNGDDIPDFLGGAEDGRLYYLRNPRAAK